MFIGRSVELGKLRKILSAEQASICMVYGRRRVGKTTLIETTLANEEYIKLEGKENQSEADQIKHCLFLLSRHLQDPYIAKLEINNWSQLFYLIADKIPKKCRILYLEELQWLANYNDTLISDLKEVWDNIFSKKTKFKLILCGSSPSFMLSKVIKSKSLYNRSEFIIPLEPFSLLETQVFFGPKKSPHEVLDAYLTVGGIPEYLKYLQTNSSVYLSLCENSLEKSSFFALEYEKIFTSSLSSNIHYKKIIEYLSHHKFATRDAILKHLQIKTGGAISKVFEDLIQCGFVEEIKPFNSIGKNRLVRYAIADHYLHFYFKFLANHIDRIRKTGSKNHQQIISISKYRQWLGYAFERWCRNNDEKIAKILGFENVEYQSGSYFNRELLGTDFQIDLLFARKDQVVTVCEIKYTTNPASMKEVHEFEKKIEKLKLKNKQTIQRVLISVNGADDTAKNYFDRILTLEHLIKD